jgi:hypothetical protein
MRHVFLPKSLAEQVDTKGRLLSDEEWRGIGKLLIGGKEKEQHLCFFEEYSKAEAG